MKIQETQFIQEALRVAQMTLKADNAIGEIVGETGTGKSTAAQRIVEKFGGVRVSCWDGINKVQLLKQVALAFGIEGAGLHTKLLTQGLPEKRRNERYLLVVDEANKLNWRCLEVLRFLADERGIAVILVGTELYERQFTNTRTAELLLQLGRRIGSKRTKMNKLDRAQCYAHVQSKMLGECLDKELISKFWHGCRKGVWGDAVELAQECQRLMRVNNLSALNEATLDAALEVFANRHVLAGVDE